MPIGLSSTIQPWTSRFLFFFAGCTPAGCWSVATSSSRGASFIIILVSKIALDCRRSQKLLDPFRFVESLVDAKPNLRCKFQVNAARDLAAHITFVAIERFEHLLFVVAAERHDVDGGEPQRGTHTNFGNGD